MELRTQRSRIHRALPTHLSEDKRWRSSAYCTGKFSGMKAAGSAFDLYLRQPFNRVEEEFKGKVSANRPGRFRGPCEVHVGTGLIRPPFEGAGAGGGAKGVRGCRAREMEIWLMRVMLYKRPIVVIKRSCVICREVQNNLYSICSAVIRYHANRVLYTNYIMALNECYSPFSPLRVTSPRICFSVINKLGQVNAVPVL